MSFQLSEWVFYSILLRMINISTPSRICLFGEHQDYLGLPVAATSISLRSIISGKKRDDKQVIINLPDIKKKEMFYIDQLDYQNSRDYFKSGIKVCKESGMIFNNGFECTIRSNIPIKAGLSSSSSIVVGWINFLSFVSDNKKSITAQTIADLAFKAEVLEFDEPGGMMDQNAVSFGNTLLIDPLRKNLTKLDIDLGNIIIGDSKETKDTLEIIHNCKDKRMQILSKLKKYEPNFDLHRSALKNDYNFLNSNELELMHATIENRDVSFAGIAELSKKDFSIEKIGQLLLKHHEILSKKLKVSTMQIDKMIEASMNAGAYGAKITGSGGGGCMFALTPDDPNPICEAIRNIGGDAYVVKTDRGTCKL